MRLSEAIRLGAMMKPQACGAGSVGHDATCALGAALDAVGDEHGDWVLSARRLWPILDSILHRELGHDLLHIIIYFNDVKGWSRERIADWVETLEAQQAAGAVDPHVPVPKADV